MTDTVTEKATWDAFEALDANLLRGIYGYGFEAPSEIQQKALPALIAGRDVVAQAQSGTGKTGAFVVGALSRVDTAHNAVQALLVSPTKELALQTAEVARAIGGMMEPPLRVAVLYGGVDTATVIGAGGERPHVICGCPGRIYDIMTNSRFHVGAGQRRSRGRSGPAPVPLLNPEKDIRIIVLDEADELLKPEAEPRRGITVAPEDERMGFREQMYHVFQHLATSVQVALFTATMPAYMDGLIEKIMNAPEIIKVAPDQLTLEGIQQYYVNVYNDYDKLGAMREIYKDGAVTQSIIYCNTVTRVMGLYNEMSREGFPVCCIHGEMSRGER
jgi:superfamily II DNA/RNA helicase